MTAAARNRTLRIERLLPFVIVAAGVLAYANTFGNPFLFDDSDKGFGISHCLGTALEPFFASIDRVH